MFDRHYTSRLNKQYAAFTCSIFNFQNYFIKKHSLPPHCGLKCKVHLPNKRLFWSSLRVPWEKTSLFIFKLVKNIAFPMPPEISSDFTALTTVSLKPLQIVTDELYYKYIVLQLWSDRKYIKHLDVICHLFVISMYLILPLFEY